MRPRLLRMNQFFQILPAQVRRYRLAVWIAFTGLTVLAAAGIPRFNIDMSWNALLGAEEPVKQAYDRFRAVFGSDEVLYLVYEARDGDVFSGQSLAAVADLQAELEARIADPAAPGDEALGHITRITSLINASFLEGQGDTLISRDFVGDRIPTDRAASDRLRRQAMDHPDYPLVLCSKDGRFGGILIRTDFNAEILERETVDGPGTVPSPGGFDFTGDHPKGSPLDGNLPAFKSTWIKDYVPFMNAVYRIKGQAEYTRHLAFYPAGNPELMGFLGRELEKEMALILLGSLVLILLVLGLLFRSFSAVLWPLIIIVSTLVWTVGAMGWSGIAMTDFINIVIFLLIAVGVADSVHILSGYRFFRGAGQDHDTAVFSVYQKSGLACFLTSVTTAFGLLALGVAPIVAVQRLALFSAFGVLAAFVITVVMLPLMLDLLPPRIRPAGRDENREPVIQRLLVRLEQLGTRYPLHTLFLFALAAALLAPGILRIRIDSNVLTVIREDRPIRANFDRVDRHMAGTGNIEILVDTGQADGMKDPRVLEAMVALQSDLETRFPDIVRKTLSLVNVTRDSFRTLNENRSEMYIIPDDPTVLAQTLFLFGTANPLDRRLLVSDDFRAARIIINTRNLGSREGLAFMGAVDRRIAAHFSTLSDTHLSLDIASTGQIPLFLAMMDLISRSQIRSFGICLVLVSITLLLVIGRVRTGLVATVPNLFPILAVFGLMGWLDIPLDVHTLLVVPIIIGISVDDTLHFMTHFSLEMNRGKSVGRAIRLAVREAGQAIAFTSLVLAVGYLAFLICVNKGFAWFGGLSSVAVLTALLADLVLLPALLRLNARGIAGAPVSIQAPKETTCVK